MQQPANDIIESLLEKPCWVIDFLPHQVPAEQGRQFFKIEKLLLQSPHINQLYDKFAAILLQLYCYYDIHLCMNDDDVWAFNPEPEHLLNAVHTVLEQKRHLTDCRDLEDFGENPRGAETPGRGGVYPSGPGREI